MIIVGADKSTCACVRPDRLPSVGAPKTFHGASSQAKGFLHRCTPWLLHACAVLNLIYYYLKVGTCSKFCTILAFQFENVQNFGCTWTFGQRSVLGSWINWMQSSAKFSTAQNVQRFCEHSATFDLLSLTEGTTLVINLVLRRYLFYSRPGEA